MKTWWVTNEFWPKANEQHYAFSEKPSVKEYGETFEVVQKSEYEKVNEALKVAVDELEALRKVYYMNREYIEMVKARLTNQGYVTELDIKNDTEGLAKIRELRGEG